MLNLYIYGFIFCLFLGLYYNCSSAPNTHNFRKLNYLIYNQITLDKDSNDKTNDISLR